MKGELQRNGVTLIMVDLNERKVSRESICQKKHSLGSSRWGDGPDGPPDRRSLKNRVQKSHPNVWCTWYSTVVRPATVHRLQLGEARLRRVVAVVSSALCTFARFFEESLSKPKIGLSICGAPRVLLRSSLALAVGFMTAAGCFGLSSHSSSLGGRGKARELTGIKVAERMMVTV
ncbi:hypothetical protein C8J57DRAFT_1651738 [Mycena rebaudengoi]|nr:hypothetical protein C8J57DRAFT_1651738 [Mycena rebaudengoi]